VFKACDPKTGPDNLFDNNATDQEKNACDAEMTSCSKQEKDNLASDLL